MSDYSTSKSMGDIEGMVQGAEIELSSFIHFFIFNILTCVFFRAHII
ncbi:hypothetical protein [uncultured Shewanella sp.]|nr:hypothetical protein [uncultured Shewanella sp.]